MDKKTIRETILKKYKHFFSPKDNNSLIQSIKKISKLYKSKLFNKYFSAKVKLKSRYSSIKNKISAQFKQLENIKSKSKSKSNKIKFKLPKFRLPKFNLPSFKIPGKNSFNQNVFESKDNKRPKKPLSISGFLISLEKNKYFTQLTSSISSKLGIIKNDPLKKSNKSLSKTSNFVGIYYSENKLNICKILYSKKLIRIDKFVQINVPTDIIGDFNVENSLELSRIIDDIIVVFDSENDPLILQFGSSFLSARSFSNKEVLTFSSKNPIILSKSPFLPDNTLLQFDKVNGDRLNSFLRIVYSSKSMMNSWINVLSELENPIASITGSCLHLIDQLENINPQGINIFCDVEQKNTTLYFVKCNCELLTVRLPYGSSIYKSDDFDASDQFYNRLNLSILNALKENDMPDSLPTKIYALGTGFDILEKGVDLTTYNIERFNYKSSLELQYSPDVNDALIANNTSMISCLCSSIEELMK